MKAHYSRTFKYSFFNDEKIKKIILVAVKQVKQKIVVAAAIVIEIVKSEICVKNINFFDFTMLLNLLEFCISVISADFLHHLIEIVVNYQKNSVLKTLRISFRDFALQ